MPLLYRQHSSKLIIRVIGDGHIFKKAIKTQTVFLQKQCISMDLRSIYVEMQQYIVYFNFEVLQTLKFSNLTCPPSNLQKISFSSYCLCADILGIHFFYVFNIHILRFASCSSYLALKAPNGLPHEP